MDTRNPIQKNKDVLINYLKSLPAEKRAKILISIYGIIVAGDIFVGFDKNCPPGESAYNDGYVNSDVFEAFRMATEAALSKDFAPALDIILEGQYMNIISFIDLGSETFNAVINTLRSYFSSDADRPSFFVHAKWAWDNVVEPFLSKDERYCC